MRLFFCKENMYLFLFLLSRDIEDQSKSLLVLNTDVSSDFVIKSKSVLEVGRWKAIELQFYFYSIQDQLF